ncbi:MAG: orotate phosphoribosyltransferase [archaeon]
MENTAYNIAEVLLSIKAIALNAKKPFRYASGILSPIYCDNRLVMSYPIARAKIIDAFVNAIKENNIQYDVICGIATAGIPHAAFLADKLNKPMIYVRSEAKDHGKENLVEGKLLPGQKVLIIEDHISTGGSSLKAIAGVRFQGGIVDVCLAVSTYEMKKAEQGFIDAKCKLITMTNFTSIIEQAAHKKYITPEEKNIALDWKSDTVAWGKKHGFE